MNRRDFIKGLFLSTLLCLIPQKSVADKEVGKASYLTIYVDYTGTVETKNGVKYLRDANFGAMWVEDTASLLESDEDGD